MSKYAYIISAKRTPLGSFGKGLSLIPATILGATAIKSALKASQIDPSTVDEVFMGHVVQANCGQAPARQASIHAGIPHSVPCTTINKVCASGLKAVMLGAQSIQLDQNQIVVSGGMENMSSIPYYITKGRYGYGYGHGEMLDGLIKDGLEDVYHKSAMGCFADATSTKYNISRQEQDTFAIQSYQRAHEAWKKGNFKTEIASVDITDRKGNVTTIDKDEEYTNVIYDKIPTLRPVFTKEGTVTAANASTINDGASALVVASEECVIKNNLNPLARIISYADGAQDPAWFTTAPAIAAEKALKRAQLSIQDIDYFEVNEAFAVVALAFIQHFKLSQERVNIWGGAVALGHPLGASGARILTTLTHVLHTQKGRYGMAAICNGGGGASAMIIERL